MLNSNIERFRKAAKDGEILTVVYSRGSSPGAKRRILPIRVAGHLLYARGFSSQTIKTYLLDGLSIVDDEFPSPWIDESAQARQRSAIMDDPENYFGSWVYLIHSNLWPALGVTLREYVDKEKAVTLRAEAKKLNTQYVAPKYLAYAVANPPVFDFQEGDLFFSAKESLPAIQVVAKRKFIEVHQIMLARPFGYATKVSPRLAYQLTDDELAGWLQTGIVPTHAQIDAAQSYSEVLRYSISSPRKNIESAS